MTDNLGYATWILEWVSTYFDIFFDISFNKVKHGYLQIKKWNLYST